MVAVRPVGSPVMGLWFYRRSEFVRMLLDGMVLRVPVLGNLAGVRTPLICAALWLQPSVPVSRSIKPCLCCRSCGNHFFSVRLGLVSQLENGVRLHDAMAAEFCFPNTLRRMIRLGEESGRLEHMLRQATAFHEENCTGPCPTFCR